MIGLSYGNLASSGGDSFVYLAEQISTDFAWSVIQLNSNVSNCLRLRNTTTQAEQDFEFDSNKLLDTASISTWLGGDSAKIVTFYDASGNANNATESASTFQEDFNINGGVDSKPCIDDSASTYNALHYNFNTQLTDSLEKAYLIVTKINSVAAAYNFCGGSQIYGYHFYRNADLGWRSSIGSVSVNVGNIVAGNDLLTISSRNLSGLITGIVNDTSGSATKNDLLNQTHLRGVRNGSRNESALIKFSSELSAGEITTVKTWYNTNFNKSLVV